MEFNGIYFPVIYLIALACQLEFTGVFYMPFTDHILDRFGIL